MSLRRERDRRPKAAMDAMSQALRRIARSPFFEIIKRTKLLRHFTCPLFICCNSKMDPVEHVSHLTQLMALYSQNDGLMYKMFPSSLSPMAMRWFNDLKKDSNHNFGELIQAFGACFGTCNQVPQPIDALLSMKIESGETLWFYMDSRTDTENCIMRLKEVMNRWLQALLNCGLLTNLS